MSFTHTELVKGIAILIIAFVHLCNGFLNIGWFSMFAGVGVAIFLLCSGYGVNESFRKKGLKGFWKNKLLYIYLPSVIIGFIFEIAVQRDVLVALHGGKIFLLDIKYGWYLQFLFLLYAVFWLSAKYLPARARTVLYCLLPFLIILCKNQLYAEQALAFSLGYLLSEKGVAQQYASWKKAKKRWGFIALALIAGGSFLCRHFFRLYIVNNVVWMLFKTALALLMICLTYAIQVGFITKILSAVGKASFYMYLTHGYIFELLLCRVTVLRLVAAVVLIALSAFGLTAVQNLIKKKSRKKSASAV